MEALCDDSLFPRPMRLSPSVHGEQRDSTEASRDSANTVQISHKTNLSAPGGISSGKVLPIPRGFSDPPP